MKTLAMLLNQKGYGDRAMTLTPSLPNLLKTTRKKRKNYTTIV
jgi:hypothetical protein